MIITNNNSPMEYLAAFAIVLAVAALSAVGLAEYIRAVKRQGCIRHVG